MTSAWPVASACHSAQCSSWSKAQNKQLDEQLDLFQRPPACLSLTGEPGVDRRHGRDVNIRHKDSQEGGRPRPVVASIEGEDDSVADANPRRDRCCRLRAGPGQVRCLRRSLVSVLAPAELSSDRRMRDTE